MRVRVEGLGWNRRIWQADCGMNRDFAESQRLAGNYSGDLLVLYGLQAQGAIFNHRRFGTFGFTLLVLGTPFLDMTTYAYVTIPESPDVKPIYFEIQQSMNDAPLTRHPETGEPVRRIILGGFGFVSSGKAGRDLPAPSSRGGGCCGGGGCGCH